MVGQSGSSIGSKRARSPLHYSVLFEGERPGMVMIHWFWGPEVSAQSPCACTWKYFNEARTREVDNVK